MSFLPRFPIRRPKAFPLALLLAVFATLAPFRAAGTHGPTGTTRPATAPTHGPTSTTRPATAPTHATSTTATPGVTKTGNTLYLLSDKLRITLSPAPFHDLGPGDFIVREFIVQNDTSEPVVIKIVLRFLMDGPARREESNERTVTTERVIPAQSPPQAIRLFVPAGFPPEAHVQTTIYEDDPTIYVNGQEISYSMSGGAINTVEGKKFPIPPSFGKETDLVFYLRSALSGHDYSPLFWHLDRPREGLDVKKEIDPVVADCDTVQWPAVPQFFQSKNIIFRKSDDKFSPLAERAVSDAVMLGSTEFLLVMPGDPWPDWAPLPEEEGLPVIVRRGLGQSVAVRADAIRTPDDSGTPAKPKTSGATEDGESAPVYPPGGENPAEWEKLQAFQALNSDFEDELTRANIWTVNPARLFMALPHVRTPSVPFSLIQFALLAYVIIVGPVNYLVIRKKKKSVLLLLLTVPVISIVFMLMVILVVGIVEGWYSRASAVGVTFLDQREKTAYTRAGVNLYASYPIRKMKFDAADSVTFSNMKNMEITLGGEQVIAGPNQARIPLAYTISRAERQRLEQLRISRSSDGGIAVMNGLGVPLTSLVVKLENGEIWTASAPVPAGENVALSKFTGALPSMEKISAELAAELFAKRPSDIRFPFNDLLLTASALLFEVPSGVTEENLYDLFPETIYGDLREVNPHALLAAKKALRDPDLVKALLPPGLYMAETDKPVFYTPGCKPTSLRARHIVFGNFNVQEARNDEN